MNYTPKQLQILHLIFDYQKDHGFSPTYAELAKQLKVSTITVFEHLGALERKGAVRRRRHEARSVEIIEEVFLRERGKTSSVPVKASIAAGQPLMNVERKEELAVGELFNGNRKSFALRVKGNGMAEDHVLDGDLLILEEREQVRDGELVVALLEDGQATLKRYFLDNGRVRLQPSTPGLPPIYPNNLRIEGVFRGLIRKVG